VWACVRVWRDDPNYQKLDLHSPTKKKKKGGYWECSDGCKREWAMAADTISNDKSVYIVYCLGGRYLSFQHERVMTTR
jgi:hypothetical protein